MIIELLRLQSDLQKRVIFVGRNIRQWKHWALTGACIPIITPYPVQIDEELVAIAVGYNANGRVDIDMPSDLFEAGSAGDIRTWITGQNHAREKELESIAADTDDIRRQSDLNILKELQAKYPNGES